jgi:hypothetical protein
MRVESCWATLKAEDLYRSLPPSETAPGEIFHVTTNYGLFQVELRRNPIWARGRLFFICRCCSQRAGRLYIPAEGYDARCRRCWGLAYNSQTQRSFWASMAAFARRFPGLLK